jgi:putative cell wall-binding protein
VSIATANVLKGFAPVIRLAGSDRYATAASVATTIFHTVLGLASIPVVYVASGANFPDALTAGPAASAFGGALLLVPPSGALPTSVKNALATLKPTKIVIVGSTASVSDGIKTQVAAARPTATVSRAFGIDRYGTAAAIAATLGTHVPAVYIALGTNFPDAMAGSAAAGFTGGAILLVQATTVPNATAVALSALAPDDMFILGSTGGISDIVVNAISPYISPAIPGP